MTLKMLSVCLTLLLEKIFSNTTKINFQIEDTQIDVSLEGTLK